MLPGLLQPAESQTECFLMPHLNILMLQTQYTYMYMHVSSIQKWKYLIKKSKKGNCNSKLVKYLFLFILFNQESPVKIKNLCYKGALAKRKQNVAVKSLTLMTNHSKQLWVQETFGGV